MEQTLGNVPQPHKTIGCQDLLKDCAHSGFLRKRSKVNKIAKFLPWFNKYVILSKGCLYIFNNETAGRPSAAMSLFGFNSVMRASEISQKDVRWTFKLVHINNTEKTTHYFSAASENDMQTWMKALKKELIWVTSQGTRPYDEVHFDDSISLQSYGSIEEKIYPDKQTQAVASERLRQIRLQELEDDEKEDYDRIEDWSNNTPTSPRNRALPTPPQETSTIDINHRPPPPLPPGAPLSPVSPINPFGGFSPNSGPKSPPVPARDRPQDRPALATDMTKPVTAVKPQPAPKPAVPARPTGVPIGAVNVMMMGAGPTQPLVKPWQSADTVTPTSPTASTTPKTAMLPNTKRDKHDKVLPKIPHHAGQNNTARDQANSGWQNSTPEPSHSGVAASPSQHRSEDQFWNSVLFSGNKEEATKVIQELGEEGVYLIRYGSGCYKVLVVYAEGKARMYKITETDGGSTTYHIKTGFEFGSTEELVEYYSKNTLPTWPVALTVPYKNFK